MKARDIVAGSLIVFFMLVMGAYFISKVLDSRDEMWCVSSSPRVTGCSTDIGEAATLGIAILALLVGLVVSIVTKWRYSSARKDKDSDS